MKKKFLLYVSSVMCLSLSTIPISKALKSGSDHSASTAAENYLTAEDSKALQDLIAKGIISEIHSQGPQGSVNIIISKPVMFVKDESNGKHYEVSAYPATAGSRREISKELYDLMVSDDDKYWKTNI